VIRATLWTIAGRRGVFLSSAGLALAAVVLTAVARAIVHARDAATHPSVGGDVFVEQAGGLVFFVTVVAGILLGAVAGAYDGGQGTMRYLVMTGRSRLSIYASRAVALLITLLLAIAPAVALLLVLGVTLPHAGGEGIVWRSFGADLWATALFGGCYALVSMGIGSLLRSSGAAIAVALVLNFALWPVVILIAAWNQTVAELTFPAVLGPLLGDDEATVGAAAAAVALAGWLALVLGAGWARIARDEY
jgi:ABC-type transport system involved in multi-copper enzyme maturation permease subunit